MPRRGERLHGVVKEEMRPVCATAPAGRSVCVSGLFNTHSALDRWQVAATVAGNALEFYDSLAYTTGRLRRPTDRWSMTLCIYLE